MESMNVIFGKVRFQIAIRKKMATPELLQPNRMQRMAMGYTIWQEMCGNGVQIGLPKIVISEVGVKIPKELMKVLHESCAVVPIYAMNLIAIDIVLQQGRPTLQIVQQEILAFAV